MKTASCQPERVSSRRLYFCSFARGLIRVSGVELPGMSKLFKRKGFRLASVAYFLSLGTLAVALLAWFSTSSTFSWFASNKTVDASGMAIKVKADEDVDIEMHVYKYVTQADGSSTVEKDPTDSNGNIDASLSRYDQVFQEDNNKAPVLLRLTLTGGVYSNGDSLPLKIYRNTGTYASGTYTGTYNNTLATYNSDGTLAYSPDAADATYGLPSFISSVISVKAFVINDTTTLAWDDNALGTSFENARTTFSEISTCKQFVTQLKGVDSKTATRKATSLDFSSDLTYYATDGTCYVYIWIDYDTTSFYTGDDGNGLINAYIGQMKMDGTGVNISYPLLSDISTVEVKKQS